MTRKRTSLGILGHLGDGNSPWDYSHLWPWLRSYRAAVKG
jgi:hypothetical protein